MGLRGTLVRLTSNLSTSGGRILARFEQCANTSSFRIVLCHSRPPRRRHDPVAQDSLASGSAMNDVALCKSPKYSYTPIAESFTASQCCEKPEHRLYFDTVKAMNDSALFESQKCSHTPT